MLTCVDVTDPALECPAPDQAACECAGCALPECGTKDGFNDCVCSTCADDAFCSNPANCTDDGECDPFNEGCVCADCAAHPACVGQIEICDNGMDDNGNGLTDCDDLPFCAADPGCAEDCDNATDDNGNGLVDCADVDYCTGDPACVAAACMMPTTLMLGATTGDTTGGTTLLDSSCQGPGAPEEVYTFTPAVTGFLSIDLTTMEDLGVYVRTTCVDSMTEIGCVDATTADEHLAVPITSGVPITVVVDGFDDMQLGAYTITLAAAATGGCIDDSVCDAAAGEACTCADCAGTAVCGACDMDAMCENNDACTCAECNMDAFCTDPLNCTDDGFCDQFLEGCQCADCAGLVPNCP